MPFLTPSLYLDTVILGGGALLLFYAKYILKFQYWKRRNVPFLEPQFPFGNIGDALRFKKPLFAVYRDIYDQIKYELNLPYCGIYTLGTPVLVITDPKTIKQVLIKDFEIFNDRGVWDISQSKQPLLRNLSSMAGEEWRKLRNKMSPTFTSGKMKEMFPLVEDCGKHLVRVLTANLKDPNHSFDVNEWLVRYMTEVISSSVFGIENNVLENPECEFMRITKTISTVNTKQKILAAMCLMIPPIRRFIQFDLMDESVTSFYTDLVRQTIRHREAKNIERNDFLNIMIQMKKEDPEITEEFIAAQCFVFFIAGFDPSFQVLTHCLYELANNKKIQDALRQEIWETKKRYGGELQYESLSEKEMPLLDRVIKECLRMYPPLPQLDRITNRAYKIPNSKITLDANTRILIPIYALHRDPEYFPNPDRFDPDRFAPENVYSIPNDVYTPFGDGPRQCIGKRYGIFQMKSGLSMLISNFEWSPDPTNKLEYCNGATPMKLTQPIKLKARPVFP